MKVAMPSPARATAWAAFLVTVQASALVTAATVDCGTASLRDFCTIVGRDFTASQATCSASAVRTMREIQEDAKEIGLILTGVAADLAALERLKGPKIVHLSDPAHFLVLVRSGPECVQLMDNGHVAVVSRNEFEQRYTGHALVGAASPGGHRRTALASNGADCWGWVRKGALHLGCLYGTLLSGVSVEGRNGEVQVPAAPGMVDSVLR